MDFQFAEDFKKLTIQCPPNHYKPQNKPVYRWVFDEITDERNFQPLFYRNPRKYSRKDTSDKEKCGGLALSLFTSEEKAKDRFYELKNTTCPIAYKVLGTGIAEATINEQDGVNEEPNNLGHFNHHPVVNHDYENRFTIISKL
jgi:hypothetical protein